MVATGAVPPDCWLLVGRPTVADAPTDYRLSTMLADTLVADLVRLAKVRQRIEHDYPELKHGSDLNHFDTLIRSTPDLGQATASGPQKLSSQRT
ncbi:hypothetical protein AB0B17_35085 [Streptomyces griseofuscus]|nr:hypothetical protein [Streptomyces murinus]MBA9050570.1 hypothetical protein [Streptomyces murinus]